MSSPEHNKPHAARPNVKSGGAAFAMPEQSLQTQVNVAGNATFPANPSSNEALAHLSKELSRVRKTRREEIRAVENEFDNVRDLARCYVVPDLQDRNPPDEMNSPSLILSRQPAFSLIDEFLRRPNLADNGNRCLFIFGDAGMGKTSLLLMLKLRHLTSLLPTSHDCVLMKLGPDTLDRIAAVPHPANTVLLLDSLDEDPEAHRSPEGAKDRLLELFQRIVRFHRVVLTCRTQFFPETSRHLVALDGHFVLEPFECPLKYISLFTDEQVELYLRKRFQPGVVGRLLKAVLPWRLEDPKLAEAREAARSMESLRLRPLLLSRIDDFVSRDDRPCVDFRNSYAVYHRLVDQWLMRDAQKHLGMETQESWRVATSLALYMARQSRKRIPRQELVAIPGLEKVAQFKIEAWSLVSRTEDHQFQFAHATIQEFLLAHAILSEESGFDVRGLRLSRQAYRFARDGQQLIGKETLDLRGATVDFAEAAIDLVRLNFGLDLVQIPSGEFLMGSPENEAGRSKNETQHRVRLTKPFWIGRYPVTQEEYQAVMGNNPSHFKGERRPVEQVSWDDAVEFCRRLTEHARDSGALLGDFEFRLPTEAEWEYACRAGTTTAFNDGSNCTQPEGKDPALERLGWYDKNSGHETHLVGEKEPNTWGLHDMHGNVVELCSDYWADNYPSEPQTDPTGPNHGTRRVVRGGSGWYGARSCRSASRDGGDAGHRYGNRGFRLAAGQPVGSGATGLEAGGAERRG